MEIEILQKFDCLKTKTNERRIPKYLESPNLGNFGARVPYPKITLNMKRLCRNKSFPSFKNKMIAINSNQAE